MAALALSIAAIAAATLTPVTPDFTWRPRSIALCVLCGDDSGLDALNNVLLFLPFGAAAAAAGWRRRVVVLAALAGALAVETMQFALIVGRYASASDVVFNATGGLVGWMLVRTHRAWLAPTPRGAARGTLLAGAAFAGIAAATGSLIAPRVPDSPLVAQWVPRRAVVFTGALHRAAVNGQSLPRGPLSDEAASLYRQQAAFRRATIEAEVTPGAPPRGFAPIIRLVTGDVVHLALGQTRDSMAFIPALRSRALGFRTLSIRVPVPQTSAPLHVTGRVDPTRLTVTVEGSPGRFERSLPLTSGLGWALLLPVHATIGPWHWMASAGWLAILLAPVGYYAAAAADRRGAVTRGWRDRLWWVVAPGAIALGLGLVPTWLGLADTPWTDWVAAGTGAVAGGIASRILRRARFLHGAVADPWTANPSATRVEPMRQAR